jgi:hypothetical protein
MRCAAKDRLEGRLNAQNRSPPADPPAICRTSSAICPEASAIPVLVSGTANAGSKWEPGSPTYAWSNWRFSDVSFKTCRQIKPQFKT